VKIHGRDVMGTWKVIVGLVLVPGLWIFYSAMACWLSFKFGQPPWGEELCLVAFFSMPFFFYGSILAGERTAQIFKSLPALVMSVLGRGYGKELVEQRHSNLPPEPARSSVLTDRSMVMASVGYRWSSGASCSKRCSASQTTTAGSRMWRSLAKTAPTRAARSCPT